MREKIRKFCTTEQLALLDAGEDASSLAGHYPPSYVTEQILALHDGADPVEVHGRLVEFLFQCARTIDMLARGREGLDLATRLYPLAAGAPVCEVIRMAKMAEEALWK